jgi:serine/threonine protein kinase
MWLQLITPVKQKGRCRKQKDVPIPVFFAEPSVHSNSFVGTEEYIAPEIILGQGHSSAVDWWALGVLIYEMVYGRTPFRGKNRQTTFTNILEKDLLFPANIPVSLEGRQLMRVLLEKDPAKRLGSLHGANDIKTHPFFYGMNWPLIRNMVGSILSPPLLFTPLAFFLSLFLSMLFQICIPSCFLMAQLVHHFVPNKVASSRLPLFVECCTLRFMSHVTSLCFVVNVIQ